MNYYEHHIGDYAKDAGHLSMMETGAYRRLLDAYYSREQPLPGDVNVCCKLARATTKAERDAVQYVLAEFFDLGADGYHQSRCDAEIARCKEREKEGAARRENEADRQRRHRERRKELFDALRVFAIVPKFDTPTNELESLLSRQQQRDGNAPVTRDNPMSVTPHATAIHKPVTSNQKPEEAKAESKAKIAPDDELFADASAQVVTDFKALRSRLRAPITVTAMNGIKREAEKAGLSLNDALTMCCERGWRGFKAEWINGHGIQHTPSGDNPSPAASRRLA